MLALSDQLSVEIEGTTNELRELSTRMKVCSEHCEVLLSAPREFDDRGLRYLTNILLSVTAGPLVIALLDRTLLVSGEKQKIDLLSQNVDWLFSAENQNDVGNARQHLHVEYYSEHLFLSEDAIPLVFCLHD